MWGYCVKNRVLLMIIGGIMMLGGIVAAGMAAIMLYIFFGAPNDVLTKAFLTAALAVALAQMINGLLTILKSDKKFSVKPFFITDIAIIVLSVILLFTLGTTLPTLSLTGIIVPLLHIVVVNICS